MKSQDVKIIGTARSQDVLRNMLRRRQPGRILDAAAGEGALALLLKEHGWDVHCVDIDPGNFQAKDLPFTQADLNRQLPFPDASFDVVVCVNALHRLFNPGGAIREFARIVRPGGVIYLNIPNFASIDRRVRFFFCGSLETSTNEGSVRQTIEAPEAHVRMHLLFPQVANILQSAGLHITRLEPVDVRAKHRLLCPLAWLARMGALIVPSSRRSRDFVGSTNSSAICPGGVYLLIEAARST
ncbi:MAG: methyltransferase domain-containing protein [Phycisphaeraceae bacterium]